MLRVLFICHGNICRSTMAESVFSAYIRRDSLEGKVCCSSAATRRDEIGNPPHRGTVRKLQEVGIPLVPHRARLLTRADGDRYDFIIGMDEENRRDMLSILGEGKRDKISLLLDYTGRPRAIADPWYTGNFDETYADIVEGLEAFLRYLGREGLLR